MALSLGLDHDIQNQKRMERELLFSGIRMKYGYDFGRYAESSMARLVEALIQKTGARNSIDLLERVLRSKAQFEQILPQLTITESEMFRDPQFFKLLRKQVVPVLKTFPHITLWSAGCGNGEEVYSLAILLEEEGLLDRATIFATDINPKALRSAKEGIFPAEQMKVNTKNYVESGGTGAFHSYYSADYGLVKMNRDLMRNTVFSDHNLATDYAFTEAHLILCRNVFMYFDSALQDRAMGVFNESLARQGYFALGSHEGIKFSRFFSNFQVCDERWRLFRKRTGAEVLSGRG